MMKLAERRVAMKADWFLITISIAAVIYAIAITIYVIQKLVKSSNEEKLAMIKRLIAINIDAMVAEAEFEFLDYEKSGLLKWSYVMQTIYEKYPELYKVSEQEKIIKWLDELIEKSVLRLQSTKI